MDRRETHALRVRVHALREAMQAARLDYLRAQLELALMQGKAVAADRLTRQLRNLLNTARSKPAKHPRKRDRSNGTENGAVESPQIRGHSPQHAKPVTESHQCHTGTSDTESAAPFKQSPEHQQ